MSNAEHPTGYQEIADQIEAQILSGELQNGDKLQSERKLSDAYGVNRLTVRRAFDLLANRGLINRRHGGGTYVSEPRIERMAGALVPFTPAIQRSGLTPGVQVISFDEIRADRSVAEMLDLARGAPVYNIYRVRTVNGEPAMLEHFFVSCELFPAFDQHDHHTLSGYEIMENEYGIRVERATQSLESVVATTYEAAQLSIKPGAPLMLERRLAFDGNGRPIEFGKDLYRGDKFRFVTTQAKLSLSWNSQ